MNRILSKGLFSILFIFCLISSSFAQSGKIVGAVKDIATGDALVGANLYLEGTAIGAATDLDGTFAMLRIPPGDYTVKVSYIGYQGTEMQVTIAPGETKVLDVELKFDVIAGEEVVITAQAEGQVLAINQQIRSNTIMNVVSAERIQEFPDANAAESVGRLPGISIKRDGGEANKIVIRGLAPTYNTITIGGEKVPATDLDDRSVELNMISPEILAGIEVTKALTPDKDADAIGGIVNFKLATAQEGGFRYNFRFQGGYNALRNEPGQYKGSLTLTNRYWNDKFGLMITGNIQRAQRGSDQFSAGYSVAREKREGEQYAPISVNSVTLEYTDQVQIRSGFSALMDYRLGNGKIMLSNFMSRVDRDAFITRNQFNEGSNWHERRFRNTQRQTDVLTNSLSGEHSLNLGDLDWRVSRTASLTRHPYDNYIRFQEKSAFDQTQFPAYFGPDVLINAAYNNIDKTHLYNGSFYTEKSFTRDYTTQFNLQIAFTRTNKMAGFMKLGGKYIKKSRERDRGQGSARFDMGEKESTAYERHHTRYGDPDFQFVKTESGEHSIQNYINPNFDAGNFLDGTYEFGPGLDADELNHLLKTYLLDSLYSFTSLSDGDDYEMVEAVSAGYIMAEINVGRFLMFLPGVRYEQTNADMTGRKTTEDDDYVNDLYQPVVRDTNATAKYGHWFPMFHTRIRPMSWFDIRLAYTKSQSRPPLNWMMPYKIVSGSSQTVRFGRPDLQPQISTNYDIFLSLYSNSIGLLTLGGFYKEVDDLIFERKGHKILDAEKEGFSPTLQGLTLDQPENNQYQTKLRGWEFEWQTNFHWLPSPFDGIVMNVNYSHIWSETQFPRSLVTQERIPVFPFVLTAVVDTFRIGDMPDQSDDIANFAIGYDKGPFSARLSMLYQGKTLSSVGERPELDGFTADLFRMDLSVKYKLTRDIGLYFNWNNITDEPDESFQQLTNFATDREFYGSTIDIGIGYVF
jgi:TonB-dependent receptor